MRTFSGLHWKGRHFVFSSPRRPRIYSIALASLNPIARMSITPPAYARYSGCQNSLEVEQTSTAHPTPIEICWLASQKSRAEKPSPKARKKQSAGMAMSSGQSRRSTSSRVSAHFCRAIRSGGNGQPIFRARWRTLITLRFSAAATLTTDAPCATKALKRSSSASVHFGFLERTTGGFMAWSPDAHGLKRAPATTLGSA
jgi:hypothetical protein